MKNWNYSEGHAPHQQAQIYDEYGNTIAVTYSDEGSNNAKLMAKAPEMEELLKWIVEEATNTPKELSDALLGLIKLKANTILYK